MTRVIITGAKGRMGQALVTCAKNFPTVQVVAGLDQNDALETVIGGSDVVIDFSSPQATPGFLDLCLKHQKVIVIGTTGHTVAEKAAVDKASAAIPIVLASNFSTGVNTLFWLTRK